MFKSVFTLGFLIGIYSYAIFFLGINNLIYVNILMWFTFIFWGTAVYWVVIANRDRLIKLYHCKNFLLKGIGGKINRSKLVLIFFGLFILQSFVNLIGALGPELAFDALWYHLTIPKIWLENKSIFYIPGGLFYYSAMPKLAEMLYLVGLALGNETFAKLIHYLFGLLTSIAIYKLSRKFFTRFISLLAVVIFYSNLVVAWESITAYIDLVRAFYEIMALWAFVIWHEKKRILWLLISAIMVGLAITTKLLAIGTIIIFSILIANIAFKSTNKLITVFRNIILFWFVSLLVPLPWFIFSYNNTGNPVFPFFSSIYHIAPEPLTITRFLKETWGLLINSPDPLTPIYLIMLPLIFYFFSKFNNTYKIFVIYSLLSMVIWYFTPRTGGGRFILPYLPAWSILCVGVLGQLVRFRGRYSRYTYYFLIILIAFVSFISVFFRFAANYKYIPVVIGLESKGVFLANNLNFSFGDFYDIDGYFKKNIKSTDKVLLYGFHNLYYIDFPYVEYSSIKTGETYNYIAFQNADFPKSMNIHDWQLVYKNSITYVKLYKLNYSIW